MKTYKSKKSIMCAVFLLAAGCLFSCGRQSTKEDTEPGSAAQKQCYGLSVNMRNGGLTEGDDKGMYYVWNGSLCYAAVDGESVVLDAHGGRYLCLAEDTLYYVSEDDNGISGIYARENKAEQKRTLVYETAARYLYAREGWLYFIPYPERADICRVRTDGTAFETVAEGSFDSLIVTPEALYYRDIQTGQYLKQIFEAGTDGETERTGKPEEWIAFVEERMPVIDGEWLYYDLGDFLYHYKVNTQDKTQLGRLSRSADDMLVFQGRKYEGNQMLDLESGEQTEWCDRPYTALYGAAGDFLIYAAFSYGEETLMKPCPEPENMTLYACQTDGGNARKLEEQTGALTAEEAADMRARLALGDLTVLSGQREAFAARYPLAGSWQYAEMDVDGDGIEECFFCSEESSMLLHAAPGGFQFYLLADTWKDGAYELLSDGLVLLQEVYEQEGYGSRSDTVYQYEPGGSRLQISELRHLTADMTQIAMDAETDTLIQPDLYYVDGEFTGESEWQKALDGISVKRILQE